eukprot:TRINITY_DN602_c0_g2_i2.p1 TRINITY_DN602_c0_g2~~TRINITY_DN602_c0_g2_i2.p1  ORF type:complete len:124 (+),score=12.70 TRINITY_DN602_c0_g2_i2:181-552(+)
MYACSLRSTVIVVLVGLIWPVMIGIINAVSETGVQWYWLISLQHTSDVWQYFFDVCSSSFMYQLSRQPYTSIFLSKRVDPPNKKSNVVQVLEENSGKNQSSTSSVPKSGPRNGVSVVRYIVTK